MTKRIVSLIMVLVLSLSVLAVAPVSAAEVDDFAETSAYSLDHWYYRYHEFIFNEMYYYSGAYYYPDEPIKIMLHDMDFDGVPELITSNGGFSMASRTNYVYAIKNGSVIYVGDVGSRMADMFYHMNSSYRGLYYQGGNMGVFGCTYYYMKNYEIIRKYVFSSEINTTGKPITTVTNSTLYSAYKKATKTGDKYLKSIGLRAPNYELKGYEWSDIFYTLGWDKFVGKYQYLSIPKVKKFENVNGGVKVTWNSVKGAENYRLYVKSGSSWKTVGTTKGTSYTHKTSNSGKTYTYTVKCLSADKKRSTSRFISAGFKNKYIATPKLRSIKNKSNGVRFVFYQVKGASKYRIYRKTSGTSWKKVGDVSSKKDYFLDKTAKKGKKYTYTVRCVTSNGKKHVSGYNKTGLTITRK
ncbi:MAG: hypothetical protein E7513_06370 [Ruminococcaceae bacterium]|nr:hypothetical protein [Oscillospiraceae bacterium]